MYNETEGPAYVMQQRRTGLCQKLLFFLPNHLDPDSPLGGELIPGGLNSTRELCPRQDKSIPTVAADVLCLRCRLPAIYLIPGGAWFQLATMEASSAQ